MSEATSTTPPGDPVETPPEVTPPAAATPPPSDPEAATGDDEQVTLSKKDYTNLISARDKNHSRAEATEQYVMEMAQKDDINEFLSDEANKAKFPDVEVDDLMVATTPDDFEKIAGQTQARIDKAAQRRLADIEKVGDPVLSPEETAEKLKKLKANPSTASLEQAIGLRM